MGDTRTAILDCAETMVAERGYDGFSAREVAAAVGIKPASLYYHFPSKAGLVTAVLRRFSSRIIAALAEADEATRSSGLLLAGYLSVFRQVLETQGQGPVFALMTAPARLPVDVRGEIRSFIDANLSWLTAVFTHANAADPQASAQHLFAVVEGGLTVASTLNDSAVFDAITRDSGRFLTGAADL